MITHRTLGPLTDLPALQKAFRDLEVERLQILKALNTMLAKAPVGEYRMILVDENGQPAQYELVAGAGVTITVDPVLQTITLTSP